MKLIAKIKSNYLTAILQGKKNTEFRQFGNGDVMEVTDELGRRVQLEITGVEQAVLGMDKSIRRTHPDVNWDADKPIFVIGVQVKANAKSMRGLV